MQSKAYDINSSIGLEFIINLKVFMFLPKENPRQQKCFFCKEKNRSVGKKTRHVWVFDSRGASCGDHADGDSWGEKWDRHQLRER